MSLRLFWILTSFIMLLLWGCKNNTDTIKYSADGAWKQEGYSRYIELNDTLITVYDYCKIHCAESFSEHILNFGEIVKIKKDSLVIRHGVDLWNYERQDKIPDFCFADISNRKDDLAYNFEVFWNTFDENYSGFDVKNINWKNIYKEQKSKLSSKTTELELFLMFKEMTDTLNDGHIKISVPDNLEESYNKVKKKKTTKYGLPHELELGKLIAENYLDSLHSINAGMTRWGMINDVGYIQINSMLMQADYNVDHNLSFSQFLEPYWDKNANLKKDEIQRKDEANGMKKTLDHIISDLDKAKYFILDIRFNGGGKDGVAMEIVNHFTSAQKVVASKKAFENDLFPFKQMISTSPSKKRFVGPVYLITSHRTASSGELLTMSSLALDNFTRVGTATEGIFSSTLDKVLPNGWTYEFSNEIYEDLKGNNYEDRGIPPDFDLGYTRDRNTYFEQLEAENKKGKDTCIEKILELIEAN